MKIRASEAVLGLVNRDLVLERARTAAQEYRSATLISCVVLDELGRNLDREQASVTGACSHCRIRKASGDYSSPCADLHIHAASQAQRFGGSFVYLCSVGLMHWASPLTASAQRVGMLVAGPVLVIDSEEARASIAEACPDMDEAEVEACADQIPSATSERVQALSKILASLAERASDGEGEAFAGSRRKAEQQSRIGEEIHAIKKRLEDGEQVASYPLEKERALLEALRRGDEELSRKTLNELLGTVFFSSGPRFELVRFRAVELLVLLSRAAMEARGSEEYILESNYRYLRLIEKATDQEELADILSKVVDRFSHLAFAFKTVKHAVALRKGERYMREHYTQNLNLSDAAAAASLSPAYFSSIFKAELGESFSEYLSRLRVEHAAKLLLSSTMSLSEVALASGFEEQSWFTKVFKKILGVSPGRYREAGGKRISELNEIHELD